VKARFTNAIESPAMATEVPLVACLSLDIDYCQKRAFRQVNRPMTLRQFGDAEVDTAKEAIDGRQTGGRDFWPTFVAAPNVTRRLFARRARSRRALAESRRKRPSPLESWPSVRACEFCLRRGIGAFEYEV
jgi:hypothetical protein